MSSSDSIAKAAEAIDQARQSGSAIARVSETFGLPDPNAAYAVQETNTKRWLATGRRISGRKIGLTSKAIQTQLGVDQPDYGMLWADRAWLENEPVPTSSLIQPRVEAEIAFVMGRSISSPDAGITELMSAIEYVLPAVEVVDSAIEAWKITLIDTIADNASAAGYVLGTSPRKLDGLDLRLCGMMISRSGEIVSLGTGAACLGNPLNAALWLARKMAEVGSPLSEGDVVLSGALGPMVDAKARDRFHVEIQGFAPFSFEFSE
jgi:2-keto-4-pentenoate hydratase